MPLGTHGDTEGQISNTSPDGYFDVGNLRIQWGISSAGSGATVTLPKPFKNTTYTLTGSANLATHGGLASVQFGTKSTTAFVVFKPYDNGGSISTWVESFNWMAIGMKPDA